MIIVPKDLGNMIAEGTGRDGARLSIETEVARDEVLSDRVYEFDREKRQLCVRMPESIEKEKEMER